ncbi:hypothetical protein KPL74_11080 [Bacillus sp. NP157]|nr:hypothetical protein KPL74_11080 [Bacillus sp. NP157]
MAFSPNIHAQKSHTSSARTTSNVPRVRHAQPGLPIAFVRGSLFGVNDRFKDPVEGQELCVDGASCLHYWGPRLNQTHSLLWQVIASLWIDGKSAGADEDYVRVTSADLLRAIGWRDTSTRSRRWLWDRLVELQTARLELQTPRHRYSGLLLTEVYRDETSPSAPLTLRVNPRAIDLLKNEVVLTDFSRKLELTGKQLALWLHDFISSQSNDTFIPIPVSKLHALCGSKQALAQFRPRLLQAAAELQVTTKPLLKSFSVDKADRFVYSKSQTRVLLLPAAAGIAQMMQAKTAAAVNQARAQRATVAL